MITNASNPNAGRDVIVQFAPNSSLPGLFRAIQLLNRSAKPNSLLSRRGRRHLRGYAASGFPPTARMTN
ncbi:hypothetical protein [Candidatus Spongiihabitans sp.]|uniref:hypothetical protein n=1 Tax=Candidatus Spongiihabitans sp. TaxID=3101308 RepID=UPI003C7DBD65